MLGYFRFVVSPILGEDITLNDIDITKIYRKR